MLGNFPHLNYWTKLGCLQNIFEGTEVHLSHHFRSATFWYLSGKNNPTDLGFKIDKLVGCWNNFCLNLEKC